MKNGKVDLGNNRFLVKGRDGLFVVNPKDKYVGGAILTYGEFSHLEMDTFAEVINEETYVLEIGANIGAHTVGLAKMCKYIDAIEPQPQIFQNLATNVFINNLPNVGLHNIGLGMEQSCMYVPLTDYNAEGNFGGISLVSSFEEGVSALVEILPMDSFRDAKYGKNVFVKVDVEGMEEEVLRSGARFIEDHRPVMYVENDRAEKSASLIRYLESLNYTLYWDTPKLYNPRNFFCKKEDKYPGIVSINMLCVPKEYEIKFDRDLVVTPMHPMFYR
jgi:FkbM family methyltransferase